MTKHRSSKLTDKKHVTKTKGKTGEKVLGVKIPGSTDSVSPAKDTLLSTSSNAIRVLMDAYKGEASAIDRNEIRQMLQEETKECSGNADDSQDHSKRKKRKKSKESSKQERKHMTSKESSSKNKSKERHSPTKKGLQDATERDFEKTGRVTTESIRTTRKVKDIKSKKLPDERSQRSSAKLSGMNTKSHSATSVVEQKKKDNGKKGSITSIHETVQKDEQKSRKSSTTSSSKQDSKATLLSVKELGTKQLRPLREILPVEKIAINDKEKEEEESMVGKLISAATEGIQRGNKTGKDAKSEFFNTENDSTSDKTKSLSSSTKHDNRSKRYPTNCSKNRKKKRNGLDTSLKSSSSLERSPSASDQRKKSSLKKSKEDCTGSDINLNKAKHSTRHKAHKKSKHSKHSYDKSKSLHGHKHSQAGREHRSKKKSKHIMQQNRQKPLNNQSSSVVESESGDCLKSAAPKGSSRGSSVFSPSRHFHVPTLLSQFGQVANPLQTFKIFIKTRGTNRTGNPTFSATNASICSKTPPFLSIHSDSSLPSGGNFSIVDLNIRPDTVCAFQQKKIYDFDLGSQEMVTAKESLQDRNSDKSETSTDDSQSDQQTTSSLSCRSYLAPKDSKVTLVAAPTVKYFEVVDHSVSDICDPYVNIETKQLEPLSTSQQREFSESGIATVLSSPLLEVQNIGSDPSPQLLDSGSTSPSTSDDIKKVVAVTQSDMLLPRELASPCLFRNGDSFPDKSEKTHESVIFPFHQMDILPSTEIKNEITQNDDFPNRASELVTLERDLDNDSPVEETDFISNKRGSVCSIANKECHSSEHLSHRSSPVTESSHVTEILKENNMKDELTLRNQNELITTYDMKVPVFDSDANVIVENKMGANKDQQLALPNKFDELDYLTEIIAVADKAQETRKLSEASEQHSKEPKLQHFEIDDADITVDDNDVSTSQSLKIEQDVHKDLGEIKSSTEGPTKDPMYDSKYESILLPEVCKDRRPGSVVDLYNGSLSQVQDTYQPATASTQKVVDKPDTTSKPSAESSTQKPATTVSLEEAAINMQERLQSSFANTADIALSRACRQIIEDVKKEILEKQVEKPGATLNRTIFSGALPQTVNLRLTLNVNMSKRKVKKEQHKTAKHLGGAKIIPITCSDEEDSDPTSGQVHADFSSDNAKPSDKTVQLPSKTERPIEVLAENNAESDVSAHRDTIRASKSSGNFKSELSSAYNSAEWGADSSVSNYQSLRPDIYSPKATEGTGHEDHHHCRQHHHHRHRKSHCHGEDIKQNDAYLGDLHAGKLLPSKYKKEKRCSRVSQSGVGPNGVAVLDSASTKRRSMYDGTRGYHDSFSKRRKSDHQTKHEGEFSYEHNTSDQSNSEEQKISAHKSGISNGDSKARRKSRHRSHSKHKVKKSKHDRNNSSLKEKVKHRDSSKLHNEEHTRGSRKNSFKPSEVLEEKRRPSLSYKIEKPESSGEAFEQEKDFSKDGSALPKITRATSRPPPRRSSIFRRVSNFFLGKPGGDKLDEKAVLSNIKAQHESGSRSKRTSEHYQKHTNDKNQLRMESIATKQNVVKPESAERSTSPLRGTPKKSRKSKSSAHKSKSTDRKHESDEARSDSPQPKLENAVVPVGDHEVLDSSPKHHSKSRKSTDQKSRKSKQKMKSPKSKEKANEKNAKHSTGDHHGKKRSTHQETVSANAFRQEDNKSNALGSAANMSNLPTPNSNSGEVKGDVWINGSTFCKTVRDDVASIFLAPPALFSNLVFFLLDV